MLDAKRSAGGAQDVNMRNISCTKHVSEGSTLALKPRGDVTEVQNRGMSDPTKRTDSLQMNEFLLFVSCN